MAQRRGFEGIRSQRSAALINGLLSLALSILPFFPTSACVIHFVFVALFFSCSCASFFSLVGPIFFLSLLRTPQSSPSERGRDGKIGGGVGKSHRDQRLRLRQGLMRQRQVAVGGGGEEEGYR